MKHLFLYFFLLFVACQSTPQQDAFIVIPQQQTPYENGFAHGEKLQEEIGSRIEAWENTMQQYLNIERDSIFAIAFEHTGFLTAIERETPELLEEINGIAAGAKLDSKLVLAYNLGEEIFNFCSQPHERCSNLAKENPADVVLAYNQDLPPFLHGTRRPLVLQHESELIFAFPGSIGISGVSKQLAISCNSLPMLQMNPNALPLSFLLRKLLKTASLDQAKTLLKNTPCAIPQNLLCIAKTGIWDVELSNNSFQDYSDTTQTGFMAHTNFPLVNTDFKSDDYKPVTCARFEYLEATIAAQQEQPVHTADMLKTYMAESPIQNAETYLRYVATFSKTSEEQVQVTLINPLRNNEELDFQL